VKEVPVPFDFAKLNVWAVLVAALIAFLVGAVWYTVLFGKLWIKLHGFSEQKVKEMQAGMSPARFFGGMILSYLVLSAALALILSACAKPSALAGAALGFCFWLGSAAIAMTGYLASDKPFGIYLIDAACQLVYLLAMGALLGGWR
jgi:hypothetical protein